MLLVVDGKVKNIFICSVRISFGIFFFKMRCGLFNEMLLILLNVLKLSIRRVILVVRRILMEIFVLNNVGF